MRAERFWQTTDQFFAKAQALREVFEERFSNPLQAHENRFVWDYWHVPEQYTLVRTPAYHYFPDELYNEFHRALVSWGQRHLGCHDISPPWLSYYIEGCRQELHADVPHGPFAFVYSLTPWEERKFSGGETLILQPDVLHYWSTFTGERGLEGRDLVAKIPSLFNRLTVFDPRLPHGVVPVSGVQDPRQGRLVIHGWFTEPRPFYSGSLDEEQVTEFLTEQLEDLYPELDNLGAFSGLLSVNIRWPSSTSLPELACLANTLVNLEQPLKIPTEVEERILGHLAELPWFAPPGPAEITIPFSFK